MKTKKKIFTSADVFHAESVGEKQKKIFSRDGSG